MATELILCGNTRENIHAIYEKYEKQFLVLKEGIPRSDLASKVGLSAEAIQELITKDLLKLEDDAYKPTFPILVSEDRRLLDQIGGMDRYKSDKIFGKVMAGQGERKG